MLAFMLATTASDVMAMMVSLKRDEGTTPVVPLRLQYRVRPRVGSDEATRWNRSNAKTLQQES